MPFLTLKIHVGNDYEGEKPAEYPRDLARDLAANISKEPDVYGVEITEQPNPTYKDGSVTQ